MIFPNLKNKIFGYVNLNLEAKEWVVEKGISITEENNPFLNPKICEEFVNDLHKKYSLDFSYGGWMEDRTFIWQGGYLEKEKTFVHLGIDINVPAGSELATDFQAEVLKIDDDYPLDGGWGTYIILKNLEKDIYILYAHLDKNILCKVGEILNKDIVFAKVGKDPFNGNWFPHVHVQVIDIDYYSELEKNNDWEKFDGYGSKDDKELNAKRHKDPIEFISLKY